MFQAQHLHGPLPGPCSVAEPAETLSLISEEECGPGHMIQQPKWGQATWGITAEPRDGVIPEISGPDLDQTSLPPGEISGPDLDQTSPPPGEISGLLPTIGVRNGAVGRASSHQTLELMRWKCSWCLSTSSPSFPSPHDYGLHQNMSFLKACVPSAMKMLSDI